MTPTSPPPQPRGLFLLRSTIFAVLVAGLAQAGCSSSISDKDIQFISLSEVRAATASPKANAHLIDPRSPSDFAEGHIPGARNLQLQSVPATKNATLDPRLTRYKLLIVYGDDPGSAVARAMSKRLMQAGADGVRLFSGGLVEWAKSGYPVQKDSPEATSPPAPAAPR